MSASSKTRAMLVCLLESGPRKNPGLSEFHVTNLGAVLLDKENSGATHKPSTRARFDLRVIYLCSAALETEKYRSLLRPDCLSLIEKCSLQGRGFKVPFPTLVPCFKGLGFCRRTVSPTQLRDHIRATVLDFSRLRALFGKTAFLPACDVLCGGFI
jgi:hypothetical protein